LSLGGQELKQEEIFESRDPICTILITHSRLGELYFAYVDNLFCVMNLSSNWVLFDWEKIRT